MEQPQPFSIFDLGSHTIKAQQSSASEPFFIRSLAGKPKYRKAIFSSSSDYEEHYSSTPFHYFAEHAYSLRGALRLSYPIQNGLVHNWDKFERIISHIYYDLLKVDPASHPAFILDTPGCPFSQREKIATFFFETLRVPGLFMTSTAHARMLHSGKITGIIVECGEGVTSSVPIFEGIQYKSATQHSLVGGKVVLDCLEKLVKNQGIWLSSTSEREMLRKVMEKTCLVAVDYNEAYEKEDCEKYEYKLPDGKSLVLNKERFMAPEILFRPDIFEREAKGIHKLIRNSVNQCKVEERQELCENVLLGGGMMQLANIESRIEKELSTVCKAKVRVQKQKDLVTGAWKGAGLLTNLSEMSAAMVTAKEYEECGSSLLKAKLV